MKFEKIAISLFILGLLMRLFHMEDGGLITTIGALSLSVLYFGFSYFIFKDSISKKRNPPLSIIAGVMLSLATFAILFKLMYWPGSGITLLVSLVCLAILMIVLFLMQKNPDEDLKLYYQSIMTRALIFSMLCFVLYLVPVRTLMKIQYWDDPKFADISADYHEHGDNKVYRERYFEALKKRKR